jgi:hypothetical protein
MKNWIEEGSLGFIVQFYRRFHQQQ